jgi:hypothetical protein
VNWCKFVNRADGISEIEGQSREGSGERAWQETSFKSACHAEAGEGGSLESVSETTLNSDDHFDRSFSFMAMKTQLYIRIISMFHQ